SYVEIQSPFSFVDSREGIQGSGYSSIVYGDNLYMATNQGIYFKKWLNLPQTLISPQFAEVSNSKSPTWTLANIDEVLLTGQHLGAGRIDVSELKRLYSQTGVWKFLHLKRYPDLMLVGTYEGLLLFEKTQDGTSWRFKHKIEGIDLSCRIMEEDEFGNIWISHPYRGVYKVEFNPSEKEITRISFYNSQQGFPSDLGINVVKINNDLLFTTEKGVYVYNDSSDTFLPHISFNELLGAETPVYRLIEDDLGNIWFSAGEEFGRLQIEKGIIETQVEKLNFNQLQQRLIKGFPHIYAYDQNHIFIGVDDGFISYNQEKDQRKNVKIPILIREVRSIGPQDSAIFEGTFIENGKISLSQPSSQILSFPPNIRDLRFSYAAVHFEKFNEIQYQYMLEGKDLDWSSWTNKTEKEYTNLAPGDYTFMVKAQNIYGEESEVAKYQFSIQPPWYETILARVFIVLFFLMIFGFILYVNNRKIKKDSDLVIQKQAQTLQKKEAEFKRESEKSEAEIIRLRNEKLRAEVVHKNKELASYALHLGQKSETLLKLQKQLGKIKKELADKDRSKVDQLVRMIDEDIRLDKNWEQFEFHFDQVHERFLTNLRNQYPVLTPKDQRLCAYLRMNLSTKEIAPLMGISVRGVEISRYRLRKKLDIPHDANLTDFIMNL
ncbi:MAG: hypothetical protein KDE26_24030, partial [Bacteroidetes bacterium]|nr:hypothetical protein [Bacteroidota bacterium]